MKQLLFCIFLLLLGGCSSNQPPAVSGQIDELPAIYPDYTGVTVPQSIAPLNFAVRTEGKTCAVFTTEGYTFTVYASDGAFSIPNADWNKLLTAAKGKQIEISVLTEEKGKWKAFLPFHIRNNNTTRCITSNINHRTSHIKDTVHAGNQCDSVNRKSD